MAQLEISGILHAPRLPIEADHYPEGVDVAYLYEEIRKRDDVTEAEIAAFEQEFLPEA